ncbi:hypothetical protein GF323_04990 [Candidatus Woesearchaeota archaeon]|nr:hypothetical protein [Candidatus Woesearchaeota archaeon]
MDTLELGGNIQLTGFSAMDSAKMIVLKKMIGNYARKFSDRAGFEQLSLTMKTIHETESGRIYELHGKLMDKGKPTAREAPDRNIFVAVDSVLKKIEESIS